MLEHIPTQCFEHPSDYDRIYVIFQQESVTAYT